ncbi:MAG: hypothetical protein Q4F82_08905 [bacterium]|nr:hypothetical protein [bacterium]
MKKVTFFLATLLIGGMMFTGCKKENPQPTPDTPAQTTKTVVYTMDNVYKDELSSATLTVSPYFHYTFKYKDADGTMVEVNDPTLPWTKEISVTTPFEAKLEGTVTYNENELPEEGDIIFGTLGSIKSGDDKTIPQNASKFHARQQFLDFISTHADRLNYSFTLSVN